MSEPNLTRIKQVGGAIEETNGTVETLAAVHFRPRVTVGTAPEILLPREVRDIARSTLSPLGTLESTEGMGLNLESEWNTPDAFNILNAMDLESVLWQSGNTVRYTFNGTPDLSGVEVGDILQIMNDDDSTNDGTFIISAVNDGSDWIEVFHPDRTTNAEDTASLSTGVGAVLNPLEYHQFILACGHVIKGAVKLGVGAITGTYSRNETVTGGTSSATGRVLFSATGADGAVWVEPLTGLFQSSEVLTGGTSGATATTNAAPSVAGFSIQPVSTGNSVKTLTARYEEDGYQWTMRGGMGSLDLASPANRKAMATMKMLGALNGHGDQALTASVTQWVDQPPILKNASLTIGGYSPVFRNITFNQNANVVMRENGNASGTTGFETARITGRDPRCTITLEHVLAATHDFFTNFKNGTDQAIEWQLGTVAGRIIHHFIDEGEIANITPGDDNGIRTLDVEFLCKAEGSNTDREYEFVMV